MFSKNKLILFILLLFYLPSFAQVKVDISILNKEYDKALSEIESQLNNSPNAGLYMKQGMVFNLLQQYQHAAEAFFLATELDPNNANILEEFAEVLTKLDNHTDAIPVFKKALSINPENFALAGKLGSTYINLKDYKNALDVFTSLFEKDSTNVYWNKQYAFCLAKTRGKDSLAICLYESLVSDNPRDLNLYSSIYTLYSRKKDMEKALGILIQGLQEFPGNKDLTLKVANFYFGNKNYSDAANYYKEYIESGGSNYDALRNFGICLYFNKSEKEAIKMLDRCMEIAFNDPIVLFYMSLSHKKISDYELAEDFMQAAIEAATPSYLPEMFHHLGQIFGMQRKFEESIEALKESYGQDPSNFEILFEIATTYEEYNFNKTLALNFYRSYLIEGGENAENINYALTRIERIKEDLFFEE
ncbi:MAG: tetratricopeptide repeat protein [Mariniphaga sp.]|nr:tetratricopeptide repeat protein [Mariniphaga sp.]